jgi:hypothetical protein
MNTLVDRVVEQLKTLPYELQRRVFEFTRALVTSTPQGVPGKELIRFAGAIPLNDLERMREVIAESCEQVDANEW